MATNLAFQTFYNQLSQRERLLFMHDARKACAWSHSTFYYKVHHCNLSLLETAEIVKLAQKYGANESTILAPRRVD